MSRDGLGRRTNYLYDQAPVKHSVSTMRLHRSDRKTLVMVEDKLWVVSHGVAVGFDIISFTPRGLMTRRSCHLAAAVTLMTIT